MKTSFIRLVTFSYCSKIPKYSIINSHMKWGVKFVGCNKQMVDKEVYGYTNIIDRYKNLQTYLSFLRHHNMCFYHEVIILWKKMSIRCSISTGDLFCSFY